jgi:hypothetical protein
MAIGLSWIGGSGPTLPSQTFSQRSNINLNFMSENNYGLIDFTKKYPVGPTGSNYTTAPLWPSLIDANGWPNTTGTGSGNFGGNATFPGATNYGGPYEITWDGNGRLDMGNGTWTETNLVTPGTCTISIANPAVITFANSFAIDQEVVFTTTGALPTGLSFNTTYYVISAGLSGSSFQVSATRGGSAIVTSGTQSGTHTCTGTYSKNQNGRWSSRFDGVSPVIRATQSAGGTTHLQCNWSFQANDLNSSGNYVKNLKMYRVDDRADLLAGKIFRSAWKQLLVNLCPSAIRAMNWCGGASSTQCRWENRGTISTSGWSAAWTASPCYASIATASVNAYSVVAAVPTSANTKTTPASMQHGEIATIVIPSATVRAGNVTVSAITNANPGQVTTSSAHGFNTGDVVVLALGQTTTIQALNLFPVTVTVVDTTHFTIGVDTTGLGAFSSGTGTNQVRSLITLQVGSGNDRIAYPVTMPTGNNLQSQFSSLSANNYYTFYFDKNCGPITDGTYATFTGTITGTTLTASSISGTIAAGQTVGGVGVAGLTKIVSGAGSTWTVSVSQSVISVSMTSIGWKYGTWIAGNAGSGNDGETPIEVIGALIKEINAMTPVHPIGLWINIPFRALNGLDPDYSSGSDWAVNAITTLRGILSTNIPIFIEYANETWNSAGGFYAFGYVTGRSYRRWFSSGQNDAIDMQAFLQGYITRAIKASFPSSNLQYVIGGWGDQGTQAFGGNLLRISGSTTPGNAGWFYMNDQISGAWGAPMSNHDAFAFATYLEADDSTYYSKAGLGGFVDDSAMYNGTNNSGNGGGNYTGAANQAQAITNFVAAVQSGPASSCIDTWVNAGLNSGKSVDLAAAVRPYGKTAINYEGGEGFVLTAGSYNLGSHTVTSADATFLQGIINSTNWRDAQVGYFNRAAQIGNLAMQGVYTMIGTRWAYAVEDTYSGGVEGAALSGNPCFAGMGTRNQSLA